MTRALRRAHRRVFLLLALVLPPLVTVALAVRGDSPRNATVPTASAGGVAPAGAGDPPSSLVAPGIWARTLLDAARAPRALELRFDADPRVPDLLVYWAAAPPTNDELPGDAWLLGPVSGAGTVTLALPAAARGDAGFIIMYGLARHEVVAYAPAGTARGTAR